MELTRYMPLVTLRETSQGYNKIRAEGTLLVLQLWSICHYKLVRRTNVCE
jgi:hypothetical protein